MIKRNRTLDLIFEPDERLHTACESFDILQVHDASHQHFFKALFTTMKRNRGVGIAAPQVGVLTRAAWVSSDGRHAILLINPVITERSHDQVWGEEGCLSIPHMFGDVLRHTTIDGEYYDIKGVHQKFHAEDFLARVIQHEIDHLDGILFSSKARGLHHL